MGKELSNFFGKFLRRKRCALWTKKEPSIYLLTDTGNPVEIILTWMDGQETRLPRQSPAEALVEFVEFDSSRSLYGH